MVPPQLVMWLPVQLVQPSRAPVRSMYYRALASLALSLTLKSKLDLCRMEIARSLLSTLVMTLCVK